MQINKISIITVVYNDVKNISRTINSVVNQKKNFNIEYIVIDGNSNDGTKELLFNERENIDILISENDKGIYDAINKGINCASGNVVALLHSGDVYYEKFIIKNIAEIFNLKKPDIIYSDCVIYNYKKNRIFRYYFSRIFSKNLMLFGWMPPHPGCFISKHIYHKHLYSTKYKIASDFDFLFKLSLDNTLRWENYNSISVILDNQGVSSQFKNKLLINKELKEILISYGKTFFSKVIILRYLVRIIELIYKPDISVK